MTVTNEEFAVHTLNEAGIEKAQQIAAAFDALLETLKGTCVAGRHFSIVKTKLEEASFFAKKSMATDLANQKPQSEAA